MKSQALGGRILRFAVWAEGLVRAQCMVWGVGPKVSGLLSSYGGFPKLGVPFWGSL